VALNYQIIFGSMERYSTKIFYLGTPLHLVTVSTFSALRKRLFFKGEGMLGSDPNHLLYNVIRLRIHKKYILLVACCKRPLFNK
jgi:hypothetical protein